MTAPHPQDDRGAPAVAREWNRRRSSRASPRLDVASLAVLSIGRLNCQLGSTAGSTTGSTWHNFSQQILFQQTVIVMGFLFVYQHFCLGIYINNVCLPLVGVPIVGLGFSLNVHDCQDANTDAHLVGPHFVGLKNSQCLAGLPGLMPWRHDSPVLNFQQLVMFESNPLPTAGFHQDSDCASNSCYWSSSSTARHDISTMISSHISSHHAEHQSRSKHESHHFFASKTISNHIQHHPPLTISISISKHHQLSLLVVGQAGQRNGRVKPLLRQS